MRASTEGAKKAAKIYRAAAREIERHQYEIPAPFALKLAEGRAIIEDSPLVDKLKDMYAADTYPYWPWTQDRNKRDLRVLALCFMAAMVEAGDA